MQHFQLTCQSFVTHAGMVVASASASGAICLNWCTCWRDRASAILLSIPGRCLRTTLKLFLAARKNSVRHNCDSAWFLGFLACQICTMARLSQWMTIFFRCHWWPHVAAAAMIAKSSFHWMDFAGPFAHDPGSLEICTKP